MGKLLGAGDLGFEGVACCGTEAFVLSASLMTRNAKPPKRNLPNAALSRAAAGELAMPARAMALMMVNPNIFLCMLYPL